MTNESNGVYYFLGNITSHAAHALPLHEQLGGTIVVLSEDAAEKLRSQGVACIAIDDCPDEFLKLSRCIDDTIDHLDRNAKVIIFYELFLLPRRLQRSPAAKVFLWHGNALKPYIKTSRVRRRAVKGYDHIAALGPINRKRLIDEQRIDPSRLVDIGIARTDEVVPHRGRVVLSPDLISETGIDPSRRIVSYIPTYWGVSSVHTVGKDIVAAFPDEYTLIFRPHPQTPPELIAEYTELIGDRENIVFAPHGRYAHAGLVETFEASSLIIGDVSSVMLEAILLDKPLLFARDPNGEDEEDLSPIRELVESAGQIDGGNVVRLQSILDQAMSDGIDDDLWQRTKDSLFFHHDGSSVAAIKGFVESLL